MTGTVTDVDTPTVALRLSNFVLSQREIDAYDILFAKASRVAHGEYDPESDEALADLRPFTFAELLVASAGMIAALDEYATTDENWDGDGESEMVDYDELRAASQVIRALVDRETDDSVVKSLCALSGRDPEMAARVTTEFLAQVTQWAPDFFTSTALMDVPSDVYNELILLPSFRWPNYFTYKTQALDCPPAHRALLDTLLPSWKGTGNSLLETVRQLCQS